MRANLRESSRRLAVVAVAGAMACSVFTARGASAGDPARPGDDRADVRLDANGGIERSAEFTASVAKAIDRGVAHLRTQQKPDGGFGTYPDYPCALTAMAYHTLRTCGVPAEDPACARAYESLRREYAETKPAGTMRTYAAGLTMLAVADHALAWTPDRTKGKSAPKRLVDERDRTWMNDLVAYFENCQAPGGAWRYGQQQPYGPTARRPDDFDHSNTQYAAQGLRAATLLGCEVKAETWQRLADHLLRAQQQDGPEVPVSTRRRRGETFAEGSSKARARGWGYRELSPGRYARPEDPKAYGSMTAGSIASLVIARGALRTAGRVDAAHAGPFADAIRDGLAWLGVNLAVDRNPLHGGWHYYWLYALERAGDLADVEWMGDRDWYGEGATWLVAAQTADGSWRGDVPEFVPTSYALLFLRRAERVLDNRTPGGVEEPIKFDLAETLTGRDFEDLVDLIAARWRRAGDDASRGTLAAGAASIGPRIVLPLLARMDGPDAAKRRAAYELLKRITGLDLTFDPDAPAAARTESLRAFEAWYVEAAPRLRYDPKRRTLVTDR